MTPLRLLLLGAFVVLPVGAFAQEAVLSGTVADATGGVLPGVTVTAVHEATGNRFVAVTDERGTYRIPARVGAYQITAELSGFATVSRTGVQLLVGQTATVNLQMAPSRGAGDRDGHRRIAAGRRPPPRVWAATSIRGRWRSLPVQGRNWMALAMLAPGSRMTSPTATTPLTDRNTGEQREFQFSIDGQQVTSELGFGAQPRYSQESIAEFQFISNRFDATQGRSTGVQVRAITKSGANCVLGLGQGQFPGQPVQREQSGAGPGRADRQPADRRHAGRPDPAEPAALLRSCRIRARAEDQHLEHAVPALQRRPRGPRDDQDGRRASRLPDFAAGADDGEGVRGAAVPPVRPGQQQSSGRHGIDGRDQPRGPRAADPGAGPSGGERGQRRVCPLDLQERQPHHLVEPLAGGQRRHHRIAAHHVHRTSPSAATRSTRGTAPRTSGASATTSRSPTTRAAATTCRPAPSTCATSTTGTTARCAWAG